MNSFKRGKSRTPWGTPPMGATGLRPTPSTGGRRPPVTPRNQGAGRPPGYGKRFLLVLIGGVLPALYGLDWPLESPASMVNNFGGNNRRRPFLGTVFETEEAVRAAEAGEVLFTHDPERNASKLPSPLGAWIGVDHGDGLISIYGRLSKDRDVPLPRRVSKGERIAAPGQSGWSGHRGFYFSLFDRKERRWINPSMIITPLPDSRQPNILSVELKNANGQTISPGQTSSIRQGRYTLLVNAFDTRFSERENPLAPYRILCFVNGIETAGLSFETYSARDGVLMVYRNGLTPVNKIYAPGPAFEVGELWLTRGLASLEVIAQDVAGNSRSAAFRLQVE